MKNISVKPAGTGELKDLEIKPGTTARDILEALDLSGYRLRRPGSDDPSDVFGDDENVYKAVEDGEKLIASTPARVGIGGGSRCWVSFC